MAPHGDILDVGCGDGVLYQRLRCFGYGSYVGIDLSEVAIAKLINEHDRHTRSRRLMRNAMSQIEHSMP